MHSSLDAGVLRRASKRASRDTVSKLQGPRPEHKVTSEDLLGTHNSSTSAFMNLSSTRPGLPVEGTHVVSGPVDSGRFGQV